MKNKRTTQLEKFDQKWGKSKKYEEMSIDTHETEDFVGQEQLMKKGSIREAAAVFSLEGLQMFVDIFENSAKSAVNKALTEGIETIIEDALEKKIVDVMSGFTDGFRQFAQSRITDAVSTAIEEVELGVTEIVSDKVSEVVQEHIPLVGMDTGTEEYSVTSVEKVVENNDKQELVLLGIGNAVVDEYSKEVVSTAKTEYGNSPFLSADLGRVLENRYGYTWGVNISKVLMRICTTKQGLAKVGRGEYRVVTPDSQTE